MSLLKSVHREKFIFETVLVMFGFFVFTFESYYVAKFCTSIVMSHLDAKRIEIFTFDIVLSHLLILLSHLNSLCSYLTEKLYRLC